jgi:hypothetical protein
MDPKEQLASVLKDLIHDRPEQAEATLHSYMVQKMRSVAGFTPAPTAKDTSVEAVESDKTE